MSRLSTACLCAALLGLTAAAYGPIWHNDFIDFDDSTYITDNAGVTRGLSWSGVEWALTNQECPYWMPLTWLSFQFDAEVFSARGPDGARVLSPVAFHGENLAWHAANVLLLFGLLLRLTGARGASFLVAALFAVHPLHVESVAWAIERKDVLSLFFGLLTIGAYVRYVERPGGWRLLAVWVAYLLSLLAKPMLMTLPFVLLLLDYWPLRRPVGLRRLVREKGPLFALAGVLAALTLFARYDHGALVPLTQVSAASRAGNALAAYGWYLSSTFAPTRLAVLYPHPGDHWSPAAALGGAAALLGVTALAVWQARRRPWLVVGWVWFVGALLPVIGLAQGGKQAYADRFTYWPHIGLFIAVVWGLGELAGRLRLPRWLAGAAAAPLVAVLAALTWVQVGYWRDTPTVWEHTVAVTADNLEAQIRLAGYYRTRGDLEAAGPHADEAARLENERSMDVMTKMRAGHAATPP